MNTIKWCPNNNNCIGNCPKKKCYVCPWNTWEYGPDEDFFPTQQECAEDPSLRAYIDPRKYLVCATLDNDNVVEYEINDIQNAINKANNIIEKRSPIKIEIKRIGQNTIVAASEQKMDDNELYTQVGKICNHISRLLQQEKTNSEKQKTVRICKQIVNYMMFPTAKNAEKLYPVLRETRLPFLGNCYFRMIDTDVDGDRPWEEEWCDKFMGMIRTDPEAFAVVSACATNCVIDAWKD